MKLMYAAKICVQQNILKANFDGYFTKLHKIQLQKTLRKHFQPIFHESFVNIFQIFLYH